MEKLNLKNNQQLVMLSKVAQNENIKAKKLKITLKYKT